MKHLRLSLLLLALAVPTARAQQPDSTGADDPDVAALRQQFRQRWHEHIRQSLGLTDDQAAKVQATEDRFERQRVQYRGQIRDVNRQLNGEMLSGAPDNERVNRLIQQRQESRLRLEQLNRDEDNEMAGYLSPLQRVRYQQERGRLSNIIQETIRHRRAAGGGFGPRRGRLGGQQPQGQGGGRRGRRPPP